MTRRRVLIDMGGQAPTVGILRVSEFAYGRATPH